MVFNDNFLKACRREKVEHIPVWYMRQAGRYQPEYKKIRESYTLMEIVHQPEICAEVTRMPVEELDVDAAILFSDIMTPIGAMGVPFEIRENIGPCIDNPIRNASDIARMKTPDFKKELSYVTETIQLLRRQLSVPLIGFCGAPYTLASYMVEGGPSKNYIHTKSMMYNNTIAWEALMNVLVDGMIEYLKLQIDAGAQALQVFDSWVGSFSREDYKAYVLPYMKRLFTSVKSYNNTIPLIHFGVNTAHLLDLIKEAGGDVIGLDWRISITDARNILGNDVAIQGNLDPTALYAPKNQLEEKASLILEQVKQSGFVFNLGHGVTPQVQVKTLKDLTHFVHDFELKN